MSFIEREALMLDLLEKYGTHFTVSGEKFALMKNASPSGYGIYCRETGALLGSIDYVRKNHAYGQSVANVAEKKLAEIQEADRKIGAAGIFIVEG